MRLLNVHTRELSEFLSDTNVEPYAILSHTWGNEEVSCEDFQSLTNRLLTAKKGYAKIDYCCRQAADDGYSWAWIDTCCIDKRSSAELSEAINSMFRWYKDAAICYAYFVDVQAHANPDKMHTELTNSRWFTRGWTLQELLAPREMVLYSHDWKRIGSRFEFRDALSKITGIEVEYLCGSHPLERASLAKRMSWASRRNTSRTEDVAYCLLGIFDVNMPLLYGEGKKAFRRLQEEIFKANPVDHTLFAWGRIVESSESQISDPWQLQGRKAIPWSAAEASRSLRGLFAESPRDFLHSAGFSPWGVTEGFYYRHMKNAFSVPPSYPTTAGASVIIALPTVRCEYAAFHWPEPQVTQLRILRVVMLLCEHGTGRAPGILLPLQDWGYGRCGRTDELMYPSKTYSLGDLLRMKQYLQVEPQKHRDPKPGDFVIRQWGNTHAYVDSVQLYHRDVIHITHEGIITASADGVGELWAMCYRLTLGKTNTKGFGIVFHRVQSQTTRPGVGNVSISMVPVQLSDDDSTTIVKARGYAWQPRANLRRGNCDVLFARTMAVPEDTWRLDTAPFPIIEVRVKRMPFGAGPTDVIDVVDLTISDRV